MAFNFAKYTQQQGGAGQSDPAEALSRQMNLITAAIDSALSSSSSSSKSHLVDIQSTQIIHRLSQLSAHQNSDAASSSLRKLCTKANALVTSHVAKTTALRVGYSLALEIANQTQGSEEYPVETYGHQWITPILSYLNVTSGQAPLSASVPGEIPPDADVLQASIDLALDHLLSPAAQSRPEYARAVVTPNLPKFAAALVASLENVVKRPNIDVECFGVLVHRIVRHLHTHPSTYRPFVSRLHAVTSPLITSQLSSPQVVHLATTLLSALYLTGALATAPGKDKNLAGSVHAGKASQAQLWQATVSAALTSTRRAWAACVSTINTGKEESNRTTQKDQLPFEAFPSDPAQAQDLAEQQLDRLLGSAFDTTQSGILLQLLQTPTRKAVPLPLNALVSLSLDMLAVTTETPAKASVETSLHAQQSMRLPTLHLRALRLLGVLVGLIKASGTAAQARFGSRVLDRLVRLVERRSAEETDSTPASVRAAATQVLAQLLTQGAPLPLDPSSRLVVRAGRVCLAEVSHLLVSTNTSLPATTTTTSASTSGTQKKRSRLYDSDNLLSNGSSSDRVLYGKSADEQRSAIAALQAFPALYAHLSTSLTSTHYDVAHSGVQLILAVTELLARSCPTSHLPQQKIKSWSTLTASALACITSLIRHSSSPSSPFLSLLVTRGSYLASHARDAVGQSHMPVLTAAQALSVALRDVTLPRLPPVLSTQVDVSSTEEAHEEQGRSAWDVDPETGREVESRTGAVRNKSDLAGVSQVRVPVSQAVQDVVGVQLGGASTMPTTTTEVAMEVATTTPAPIMTPQQPTSPTRPTSARHSSPARIPPTELDPIKPLHRPETPTIGTSPPRSASGMVPPAPGSPEAREIFRGLATSSRADDQDQDQTVRAVEVVNTSSKSSVPVGLAIDVGDDGDEDDEEMPEIDIRSSDEEDDEEDEEV